VCRILQIPVCYWNLADLPDIKQLSSEEICNLVRQRAEKLGMQDDVSCIILSTNLQLFNFLII
jgi:hypothetical protein